MNHCVPSFEIDEDQSTPSVYCPKKATLEDDGIMELLWQNGQVVMQSQKLIKKSATSDFNGDELNNSRRREIHDQSQQQQNLFIQEDEMASWLHYPLNDAVFENDFCSDLLYSPAPCIKATATETEAPAGTTTTATTATQTSSAHRVAQLAEPSKAKMSTKPPIPPSRRVSNFGYWSSLGKARVVESVPSSSNRAANEFMMVDSNETLAALTQSRVSELAHREIASRGTIGGAASLAASSSGTGTEAAACEMPLMPSSSGTSSASPEPSAQRPRPPAAAPPDDRKRKGRELDDADCYSEDIEMESPDAKTHARGSTSAKKSRAAEVHNLSERRRRDRINEKMRALQELVPHCNKVDKASMLDEAIEYLKSLQMQVQMMSMGCSMVPMMFPGVQQYMPHPHMAAAMGMAAMSGMGMNHPIMPFPNIMPGGSLPTVSGPYMGPRFPMPTPFPHMQQQFAGAEPSKIIPPNSHSANPMMGSSFVMQNHPPNFADPYQQYLSLHPMQFPPQEQQQQNQAADHQGRSKSGTT